MVNSITSKYLPEPNIRTNQPYQMTPTYTNIHRNFTNNYNVDDNLFPFEDLTHLLPSTTDNDASTYEQTDVNIETVSNDKTQLMREIARFLIMQNRMQLC
jgi:hypothetical protein